MWKEPVFWTLNKFQIKESFACAPLNYIIIIFCFVGNIHLICIENLFISLGLVLFLLKNHQLEEALQ